MKKSKNAERWARKEMKKLNKQMNFKENLYLMFPFLTVFLSITILNLYLLFPKIFHFFKIPIIIGTLFIWILFIGFTIMLWNDLK